MGCCIPLPPFLSGSSANCSSTIGNGGVAGRGAEGNTGAATGTGANTVAEPEADTAVPPALQPIATPVTPSTSPNGVVARSVNPCGGNLLALNKSYCSHCVFSMILLVLLVLLLLLSVSPSVEPMLSKVLIDGRVV